MDLDTIFASEIAQYCKQNVFYYVIYPRIYKMDKRKKYWENQFKEKKLNFQHIAHYAIEDIRFIMTCIPCSVFTKLLWLEEFVCFGYVDKMKALFPDPEVISMFESERRMRVLFLKRIYLRGIPHGDIELMDEIGKQLGGAYPEEIGDPYYRFRFVQKMIHYKVGEKFVDRYSDIIKRVRKKGSLMEMAIMTNHMPIFKILIEELKGSDVYADKAIVEMLTWGQLDMIRFIETNYADIWLDRFDDIVREDRLLSYIRSRKVIKFLIDEDYVEMNEKFAGRMISYAVKKGDSGMIRYVLQLYPDLICPFHIVMVKKFVIESEAQERLIDYLTQKLIGKQKRLDEEKDRLKEEAERKRWERMNIEQRISTKKYRRKIR